MSVHCALLGPPGSGKGSLGRALGFVDDVFVFDTGGELRRVRGEDSSLGRLVRSRIDAGDMVPAETALDLLEMRTQGRDGLWLWDGIPRNLDQLALYDERVDHGRLPRLACQIVLEIPDAVARERLGARRICGDCHSLWNEKVSSPDRPGFCEPGCGGRLLVRDDDTPEAIARRLSFYRVKTEPVVEALEARGLATLRLSGQHHPERIQLLVQRFLSTFVTHFDRALSHDRPDTSAPSRSSATGGFERTRG